MLCLLGGPPAATQRLDLGQRRDQTPHRPPTDAHAPPSTRHGLPLAVAPSCIDGAAAWEAARDPPKPPDHRVCRNRPRRPQRAVHSTAQQPPSSRRPFIMPPRRNRSIDRSVAWWWPRARVGKPKRKDWMGSSALCSCRRRRPTGRPPSKGRGFSGHARDPRRRREGSPACV